MQEDIRELERRLKLFEEKSEYQEYTIEKLSEVVFAQQKQLVEMEERVRTLEEKMPVMLPWSFKRGASGFSVIR